MLYLLSPKRIEMTTQARWSSTMLSIDLITSNMDHFGVEIARTCQRARAGACVRVNTRLSLTIPASARAFPWRGFPGTCRFCALALQHRICACV